MAIKLHLIFIEFYFKTHPRVNAAVTRRVKGGRQMYSTLSTHIHLNHKKNLTGRFFFTHPLSKIKINKTTIFKGIQGSPNHVTRRTEEGSVVCLFFKHLVNRQHCPLLVFWKTWTFFLMADYCGFYRHSGPLEGMLSVFTNSFWPPLYAFKEEY